MRSVTVVFEDKDFEKLEEKKGKMTWREFILTLVKEEENE